MNPRIRKDIRNLAPTLISGAALMALTIPMPGAVQPVWLLTAFVITCLLTGVSCLNADITSTVLATEMAFPIDRKRLWRERSIVTLVGMGGMTLVYGGIFAALDPMPHVAQYLPLLVGAVFVAPLVALAFGPFSTLLLGDARGGIFFTLLSGSLLAHFYSKIGDDFSNYTDYRFHAMCAGATGIIAFFMLRMAKRRFEDFEDYNSFSRSLSLPTVAGAMPAAEATRASRTRSLPILRQISQEIRLQQINLIALLLGVLTAVAFTQHQSILRQTVESAFLLKWIFPVLSGAAAIAEEQRIGILEQRLSLPLSVRVQWLIKFGTNYGLCLLLGIFANYMMRYCGLLDAESGPEALLTYVVFAGLSLILGLTGSSLAKSYIEGVGATIALGVAGVLVGVFLPMAFPVIMHTLPDRLFQWIWGLLAILFVGYAGYRTACSVESLGRRFRSIALAMLAALLISVPAFGIVYYRVWDQFIDLPPDGPALLQLQDRQYMKSLSKGVALGPDRRLYVNGSTHLGFHINNPIELLNPDPDWRSVVSTRSTFMALKDDGTLWFQGFGNWEIAKERWKEKGLWNDRFDYPSTLTQFGTENDWAALSGYQTRFLALKKDGSLWQWGTAGKSKFGFVDTNRLQILHQPMRVGSNSNWIAIAADHSRSFALADDGTLHQWGNLDYGKSLQTKRYDAEWVRPLPEAIPGFVGINVTNVVSPGLAYLADGHVAITFQHHQEMRTDDDGIMHAHPDHPSITVIHQRLNPVSSFRHWGFMPYLISREGQLLKVQPGVSPSDWTPVDERKTWVESHAYSNHGEVYYLNQDGSAWRSVNVIPHQTAKLWHRAGRTRVNRNLIPPNFRLHRFRQLINHKGKFL